MRMLPAGHPLNDYEGTCGQCGAAIHGNKCIKFPRAWDDIVFEGEKPPFVHMDAVAQIFPCGHAFIVRKDCWKVRDGRFVFSVGLPKEIELRRGSSIGRAAHL
jgi:hypothetical protein